MLVVAMLYHYRLIPPRLCIMTSDFYSVLLWQFAGAICFQAVDHTPTPPVISIPTVEIVYTACTLRVSLSSCNWCGDCVHIIGPVNSKSGKKSGSTLPAGLEPATLRLTAARSSQLSYGRRAECCQTSDYFDVTTKKYDPVGQQSVIPAKLNAMAGTAMLSLHVSGCRTPQND